MPDDDVLALTSRLEGMPNGTALVDRHGDVWQRRGNLWCSYETAPMSSASLTRWRPLVVLVAEDAPARTGTHKPGCRPDPNHAGWWICTAPGHTPNGATP